MTEPKSLQQKIEQAGGALEMMRRSPLGAYAFPIPPEITNWVEEQHAWRETVSLMDQSFHMTDLYVKGPDTKRLLSGLAANSLKDLGRNKAKQFIACGQSGHLIGDMILFGLEDDYVNVVGRPSVANWVEFIATTQGYDVELEYDVFLPWAPKPPKIFRYQLQGPHAWALLEKLSGRKIEIPRFFSMGEITIAGHNLRFLRHGMGGAAGLEMWGPRKLADEIKTAIYEAGAEFGLREIGGRAYGSTAVDSGWLPNPMPAIYTGEVMGPFRDWLKADSFDAITSTGGSFDSENIEDYYFTPWDLDYGRLVQFDHDFVGREALLEMSLRQHRKKVSLVWNPDDVTALFRSYMTPGENGKFLETPTFHYLSYPFDKIVDSGGRTVGISTYGAFLAPDGAWVSLGTVDEEFAHEGSELTLIWGEPEGRPARTCVEPHVQKEIRARVSSWPFSEQARSSYRPA